MGRRIDLLDGSSTDPEIVREVGRRAADRAPVMVVLDSDHSHEHVLRELRSYAPLVTPGSYLVVCDTSVEYTPEDLYTGRPWRRGNSPATAVAEFLSADEPFIVDEEYDHKLLASVCPGGYLRRLRPNENRGASR